MSTLMSQLIDQAGNLPPFPQAAQKSLAMMRDPHCELSGLAEVISVDLVMAGLLLKAANSAYYGMPHQVATVREALLIVGFTTSHNLILSSLMASYLFRPVAGYELQRGELWRHSLSVAIGAQMLLNPLANQETTEGYHAGLLCDIGKLAIQVLVRDMVADRPEFQSKSFDWIEQQQLGVSHAELGAEMARRWSLPEPIVEAIEFHHQPMHATRYPVLAAAIHVADAATSMLGIGIGIDGLRYPFEARAVEILKTSEKDLFGLCSRIADEINKVEELIGFTSYGLR
ncbi:MAG TPA: HDOD domain-containing protein [Anaerolineaceae bacterium]|nr:HDOD domain-containing protein [Anaerolineaceae bacterium]